MKTIKVHKTVIIFRIIFYALIIIFCQLSIINCYSQGVSINITGNEANDKALLDIDASTMSSKAGILIPRITTSERDAILSPIPESLLIYNTTTKCFEAYVGTTWQSLVCGCTSTPAAAGTISGTATVCPGQNAVLYSVPAIARATNYIWTYSGTGAFIVGSTNAVIIYFSGTATSGNLTVIGTNACGNGTISADYPISVNSTAPNVTEQPISVTTCFGSGAITFAVIASGGQTYQWQEYTNSWNNVANAGVYSNVNTSILTITNPPLSMNANKYRCVISGTCTNTTSDGVATLTVNPIPTSSISGTTTVCQNATAPDITFTNPQTLPVTITYNINGSDQTTVNVGASTTATVTVPTTTGGTYAYNLVSVAYQSSPACTNTISGTATVTVNPTPTASISGTTTVCQNVTAPNITFTNPQTLPVTVTYNINGSNQTTVNIGASTTATVAAPTTTAGVYAYNLVSIVYQSAPTCSNNITGTATVTVNLTPTASISGTTSVCQNVTSPNITFTNPQTVPVTITYNINGSNQTTVNVSASTTATVAAPTTTSGTYAYNLVSVAYQSSPTCSNAITGTATVTVNLIPTITGTTPGSHSSGTGTVALGATASAGTINWYVAATGGSSLGTGTSFTTPSICTTSVYYVDATSNGCTTATRTSITATVTKSFQIDNGCTLTNNLISYYKLEDVSDFFGSNNMTATNVTFGSSSGKVNNGSNFTGSSSYLDLANNPWRNRASGSVSIWFYIPSNVTFPSNVYRYVFGCTVSDGHIGFRINPDGSDWWTQNNSGNAWNNVAGTWTFGAWWHVVITWNGSNVIMYKNGVAFSTQSNSSASGSGSGQEAIGRNWDGNAFYGYVDEVGVWSRAISSQEVSNLYNGGTGQTMQ